MSPEDLDRTVRRIDRRVRVLGEMVCAIGAVITGALAGLAVHHWFELSGNVSIVIGAIAAGVANGVMRWDFDRGPRLD